MENISWLAFFMIILASYRLTHLIVFDKITEFIRRPFLKKVEKVDSQGIVEVKEVPLSKFGYLLNCYWCTGMWSAFLIGLSYLYLPNQIIFPIIFVLSIAGAAAIIESFVGLATKGVSFLAKRK